MLLSPRGCQERGDKEFPTPTLPRGVWDVISKESLHDMQLASSSGRVAQVNLPRYVKDALESINNILTSAPLHRTSSVTREVQLPASREPNEIKECVEAFSQEVAALFFPKSETAARCSHSFRGALSVVCEHFQDVASFLQETGYTRCSIAGTRNSFADHFHVHDFYTYILYCGREIGTEVVVGGLERNALSIEERKDSWRRHTHRIIGAINHSLPSFTSDTDMGLLLPPFVAHRACPPLSQHGKTQPNLALVLTAFGPSEPKLYASD